MFESLASARHPVMSAIAGEGKHIWTYVSLAINRPWFLVTYSTEAYLGETLLLSSLDQVVDVLTKHGHEINVDQLQLVSPNSLNQSDNWLMEPLAEVWQGAEENNNVVVYYLTNGRRYVDTFGLAEPLNNDNLTCMLRFNRRVTNTAAESGTH